MSAMEREVIGSGLSAPFQEAYRTDLWSGREIRVAALPVLDLERFPHYLQRIIRRYGEIELYNFDIRGATLPLTKGCFSRPFCFRMGKVLSFFSRFTPGISIILSCIRWNRDGDGIGYLPQKACLAAGEAGVLRMEEEWGGEMEELIEDWSISSAVDPI
jgi:hypothetical protein